MHSRIHLCDFYRKYYQSDVILHLFDNLTFAGGMYEKENKDYGYQIRTRTYSNLNSRNKGPEQEPIYEVRPRGGLTYNKKPAFL